MFLESKRIWEGQSLRVMEQEHSEAEVPGGIVERQLTPAEIQCQSNIMKKLD